MLILEADIVVTKNGLKVLADIVNWEVSCFLIVAAKRSKAKDALITQRTMCSLFLADTVLIKNDNPKVLADIYSQLGGVLLLELRAGKGKQKLVNCGWEKNKFCVDSGRLIRTGGSVQTSGS